MEKAKWSSREFTAYLLLYAAYADQEFTSGEREYLFSKVSIEEYSAVIKEFNKANDYEHLQTILSFREKYFSDKQSQENILKMVKEMFLSDNEFSPAEEGVMRIFKKVLKE